MRRQGWEILSGGIVELESADFEARENWTASEWLRSGQ